MKGRDRKITEDQVCEEFLNSGGTVNPVTQQNIKEGARVHRKLIRKYGEPTRELENVAREETLAPLSQALTEEDETPEAQAPNDFNTTENFLNEQEEGFG